MRIGIACRFGLLVDSRPVAATAWLIVVCRRPSSPISVGQRAEVGVDQLRELAPLLDHADDLVLAADRAQDARVGRVAGLPLAAGRQLQLLEEDARDLLRRAEHELLARELVRLRLELLDAVGEPRGDLAHPVGVDADAGVLHVGEHRDERQLDRLVELEVPALEQPRAHLGDDPRRDRRPADERRRLLVGLGLGLELDAVLDREVVELVGRPPRLDQVGGEERVVGGHDPLGLGVVRDAFDLVTQCY